MRNLFIVSVCLFWLTGCDAVNHQDEAKAKAKAQLTALQTQLVVTEAEMVEIQRQYDWTKGQLNQDVEDCKRNPRCLGLAPNTPREKEYYRLEQELGDIYRKAVRLRAEIGELDAHKGAE